MIEQYDIADVLDIHPWRCNPNSEHSSSMIALTTISPHIGPFSGESHNLMIYELLHLGFEKTAILDCMPDIASMECTRSIGIILWAIGVSNRW